MLSSREFSAHGFVTSVSFTDHVVTGEQVIVGTNLISTRILHEGGEIKPISAKYLAIPLTAEAATKKPRII